MHNGILRKGIIVGIMILFLISSVSTGEKILTDVQQVSIERDRIDGKGSLSSFESFEEGFGAWEADADMPWEPEIDELPCWNVTRTQEYAHDGEWSLNFTANGLFDVKKGGWRQKKNLHQS